MEKLSIIEDPENCPIEDLKKEVSRLFDIRDFYESKQLAIKRFINSVYGATASQYFIGFNVDVAESITLQGQHLNHFTENKINEYFTGIFQNDKELHEAMGVDHEKAKTFVTTEGRQTITPPCDTEEFWYLDNPDTIVVAGDTDSVAGDSLIKINGKVDTIANWFDTVEKQCKNKKILENGTLIVPVESDMHTNAIDASSHHKVSEQIKYFMKHKTSKRCFRLKTKSGKSVIVTEDHSCMVMRDGNILSVKAKDINIKTDKLITAA